MKGHSTNAGTSPRGVPAFFLAAQRTMSQKTVQLVIGRLLTDEDLRLQFLHNPMATLSTFRDQGFDLTRREMDALIQTDRDLWEHSAERIHPHLQQCTLRTRERGAPVDSCLWKESNR